MNLLVYNDGRLYLLGDEKYAESVDIRGVSDDFVDRYQRFGKSVDL